MADRTRITATTTRSSIVEKPCSACLCKRLILGSPSDSSSLRRGKEVHVQSHAIPKFKYKKIKEIRQKWRSRPGSPLEEGNKKLQVRTLTHRAQARGLRRRQLGERPQCAAFSLDFERNQGGSGVLRTQRGIKAGGRNGSYRLALLCFLF